LNSIAYKLYHLNLEFNQLTPQELNFWKQLNQEDIFEWLSGSPIHPLDYSEYILSFREDNQQQQPQLQPQQPGPTIWNPVAGPSPQNRGALF